jgi:tRNA (adenine57-N1/adenine58-N1)-methyltransferase
LPGILRLWYYFNVNLFTELEVNNLDSETPPIDKTTARAGDIVELVGPRGKNFILRLSPGERLQTHRGILYHDSLIGKTWGTQVYSHTGRSFYILQPSLGDLLKETPRSTQIMYPKDIGFILVNMGIRPGQHVLEAGTGSGSLTTAIAYAVGPQGHVTTYEQRIETQRLAQKNLARLGLDERVTFKLRDIGEGFDERNIDALFLDLPNPYDYMLQVRLALMPGGSFGAILPSTNQVIRLLEALKRENFSFIEVVELMMRYYQALPEKFRPVDRMIAHTGYLTFARPIIPAADKLEGLPAAFEDEEDFSKNAIE